MYGYFWCSSGFGKRRIAGRKGRYRIGQGIEHAVESGKLPKTTIGIGIHAGRALTGNIGTQQRQQYSVTGTVVILAARIEQLNKDFQSQILASAEVIRQINHLPICNYDFFGKINLKGWSVPVGIYKLAGDG